MLGFFLPLFIRQCFVQMFVLLLFCMCAEGRERRPRPAWDCWNARFTRNSSEYLSKSRHQINQSSKCLQRLWLFCFFCSAGETWHWREERPARKRCKEHVHLTIKALLCVTSTGLFLCLKFMIFWLFFKKLNCLIVQNVLTFTFPLHQGEKGERGPNVSCLNIYIWKSFWENWGWNLSVPFFLYRVKTAVKVNQGLRVCLVGRCLSLQR